jgi:hypothetical protein
MSEDQTPVSPVSPVNLSRGEVAIVLGGKSYVMRPTFDAIRKMESLAGKGVIKIAARFQEQDFSVSDVAAVITAGINANPDNDRVSLDMVGVAIVAEGLVSFLEPAAKFVGGAITAGPKKGN